jgi:drug/metabolite transporter (DMT)-like permease
VGGLKSRALPILNVLLLSQVTGLILIALFVAVRGRGAPGGDFAVFAALSAFAGIVGLAAFYRALAIGNMGVVAPISACAGVVPVVVGIATGDRPGALQGAGLALALAGVVLASREEVVGDGGRRGAARGTGLALVSALGFGLFFLAMDRASDADVPWAMLVNRITGVTLLIAAVLVLRPPFRAGRGDLPLLVGIGTLDVAANAMYGVAATKDLVSVVAVLGSLYPITTVTLAALVLHERPHRLAQVGVVTALCGVGLVAAG